MLSPCSPKRTSGCLAAWLTAVAWLGAPTAIRGDLIVAPGWDLFETVPSATIFMGQPFEGVGIGAYDFSGVGVRNVGPTDTIVQRLEAAEVLAAPDLDTIPIELVALQLRSVNPFDPGTGLGIHYVTLQSLRGGPASVGEMEISFANDDGGLFISLLNVYFDLRLGALNGPIVHSDMLQLRAAPSTWGRIPPPGALTIDDVNFLLKPDNTQDQDFWGVPQHTGPHGVVHSPEPHEFAILAALGLLGFAAVRRARTARSAP
jgi:hypothetical protein